MSILAPLALLICAQLPAADLPLGDERPEDRDEFIVRPNLLHRKWIRETPDQILAPYGLRPTGEKLIDGALIAVVSNPERVQPWLYDDDKTLPREIKSADLRSLSPYPICANSESTDTQWHHYVIGSAAAWQRINDEVPLPAPQFIAILDSGTKQQLAFGSRAVPCPPVAVGTTADPICNPVRKDSSSCGHGTSIAGLLAADHAAGLKALVPHSRFVTFPVYKNDGSVDLGALKKSIVLAGQLNIRVINLSWKRKHRGEIEDLIKASTKALFVAAANTSTSVSTEISWPAKIKADNVIAVVATNASDSCPTLPAARIDIAAPGDGVLTTGQTPDKHVKPEGSSFAVPMVAGAAMLVATLAPGWSPAELKRHLKDSSDKRSCTVQHYGRLNVDRATRAPFDVKYPQENQSVDLTNQAATPRKLSVSWKTFYPSTVCKKLDYELKLGSGINSVKLAGIALADPAILQLNAGFNGKASLRLACAGTKLYSPPVTFDLKT